MTNKSAELYKSVYIPSLRAATIYSHVHRNKKIYLKYAGMIPQSLELEQLLQQMGKLGLKPSKKRKANGIKYISDAIISVDFKSKVRCADDLISTINKEITQVKQQIEELKKTDTTKKKDKDRIEYKIRKKQERIDELNKDKENIDSNWTEISNEELRTILYTEGFTIRLVDEKTKEMKETNYEVYKRSSAKSRTGSCLFIRSDLKNEMISWSRMGLDFTNKSVDYVSLLAYESLVGSNLESAITIRPENIFLVDDVKSHFEHDIIKVSKGEDQLLKSEQMRETISQNLFDGESLLDEEYFRDTDKSMYLLRNKFFKSAAFRCNVQLYLSEHCPKHLNYDDWELYDMFGNSIKAKNIHLITTPSSLKALKFSQMVGGEKQMYAHWQEKVKEDGSLFGIVKSEKKSKFGTDEKGNSIQRMSYQTVNSLPITEKSEVEELTKCDRDYINELKTDIEVFLDYLEKTTDTVNGNQMMIDLYRHNPDIAGTKMFRTFKTKTINKYVDKVKMGKVKIRGADNIVLLGNPIELLRHVVKRYGEDNPINANPVLIGNQVYTKMFPFGDALAGFRSPHTSPANILHAINTDNENINTYLPNLSKNIVVVNCIENPLQEILSGSDFDSDQLFLTNNSLLARLSKAAKEQYKTCLNSIASKENLYVVNNKTMAEIDNALMKSQKYIGQVTNTGQLILSNYYHALHNKENTDKLLEKLSCLTVLSGLCIDYAKRMPDVDINLQIKDAKKTEELLPYKPLWWWVRSEQAAKKGKKKLNKINDAEDTEEEITEKKRKKLDIKLAEKKGFDCPMDYVYQMMSEIEDAPKTKNVNIFTLIKKESAGKAHNEQFNKIDDILDEYADAIKHTFAVDVSKEEKEMLKLERNELTNESSYYIRRFKINPDTMYALIMRILKSKTDTIRLLNLLYQANESVFLGAFKKS